MKKTFLYTLALALPFAFASCAGDGGKGTDGADSTKTDSSASANAPASPGKGKYSIKSGIVTYQTKAMGFEVPTTLYFDDYGKKECQEMKSELEMMGTKVLTHTMKITMDGYMYDLDLVQKTGTKMKMISPAQASMTAGIDFNDLSENFLKSMKMSKEGKESICGKDCDVFKIDNDDMKTKGTFAIYNSIAMKMNMETMGMPVEMLATKFEENVSIPADKFTIPSDITITEM